MADRLEAVAPEELAAMRLELRQPADAELVRLVTDWFAGKLVAETREVPARRLVVRDDQLDPAVLAGVRRRLAEITRTKREAGETIPTIATPAGEWAFDDQHYVKACHLDAPETTVEVARLR